MIYINRETNALYGLSGVEGYLEGRDLDPKYEDNILEYFRRCDDSLGLIIAKLLDKGYDVLKSYPIEHMNYSAFSIRIKGNHIDAFKKINQDPDLGTLFSLEYTWDIYNNECNEITYVRLSKGQWPDTYVEGAYYTNLKKYIDICAHIYERIKLLPTINEASSEDIADNNAFC